MVHAPAYCRSVATITRLPLDGFTAMPWRNGGGTTHEIAVDPGDDPAVSFRWRLSMADLAGDGPFSTFPGSDRVLLLLAGDDVALQIDGAPPAPLAVGTAIAFPADVPTSLTMGPAPGRDLNLMWDRARVDAAMTVVDAAAEAVCGACTIVVALTPETVAEIDGDAVALGLHDAVRADDAARLRLTAGRAAVIRIDPR